MAAQAFYGLIPGYYVPQSYYKHGAAYTRAIVPGPNGRPVYVEYDGSGKESREIGEAVGPYERAQLMSAGVYRAWLQRLADARERYPDSAVMTAAAYRGKTFKTVDGQPISKPAVGPGILGVLVRGDAQLFSTDGKELLLLELPIDPQVTPAAQSQALLLSESGQILHQSANAIGFRVGFFGQDGQVAEGYSNRDREAQIYGPLPGVGVTLGGFITGGYALTDEQGRYSMNYFLPACPGFTFEYSTPAYLELSYKRFNPRGSSFMPYYLVRQDYDFCNGLGVYSMAAAAVIASSATPIKRPMDFPVDLMVIDGAASFGSARLGQSTAYSDAVGERGQHLQQHYDFDGDEQPDYVVPGKKVTREVEGEQREVFVSTSLEEAELQGIYLSSRHDGVPGNTEETAPDFTRLIDTAPDFQHRGLLDTISAEDLRDTDIYVFRESNGQLVAERRGLHEDELYQSYSGVDEQSGSFRFTIQLRGSAENTFATAGRSGEANFGKWQSAGGFQEAFQKRTANHLKAGETVRLIAINRATGYMGSTRIQLQAAVATGNLLNFAEQRIELAPPNLKVWAERRNQVEYGSTRGEQKRQTIGNEGAGLSSDISIAIYSDWRDADGSPLPEELADYGYTGRLAKVVAANQLAPAGANQLSQFAIKPGQQVQVIHLPEKVLARQHLYLQVAGQPQNRNPDFATGQGTGILKYRPSRYVPVQVPLHDEEASEIARQAYRKADRENPGLNLKAPEPQYAWQYRPELQFSLYELNVEAIRKTDAEERISDILNDTRPVLTSSDNLLAFYYDLLKSEFTGLEAYSHNGEKELVLAIGEQEIKATLGADQTIRFDNFEHLGALDVDDFLTMRLYANNDVGNTLMEWAFEYLSVFANEDVEMNDIGTYHYLSADDPRIEMKAVLAGYYTRREAIKKPETVRWQLEGNGNVSPVIDTNAESGIFTTQVNLPATTGSRARVYATLQGGDARAYYKDFIVVPGEPANITANFSGQLYAGGMGELKVNLIVTDRQGNRVISGTGADFSIEGQGRLLNDSETLVDGGATLTIRDALQAGGANALVVQVDGVEKRFPFSVQTLGVTPPQIRSVQENQVVDLVFGLGGADAAQIRPETLGVQVDKGILLDREGRIDASGQLVYRWHTGFVPGAAKVVFNAGNGALSTQAWEVLPDPQSRIEQKKPITLVMGASDNQLSYRRRSAEQVSIPVLAQDSISLKGTPGEVLDIRLGDSRNPNRALLTMLRPGDLERSRFLVAGVTAAKAPGFRYQQSAQDGLPVAYNYKGYGLVLSDGALLEQTATGVGIELFLEYDGNGNGQLLAWKDLLLIEQREDKLLVTRKLPGEQSDTQEFDLSTSVGPNQLRVSIKGRHIAYRLAEVSGEFDLDEAVQPALGTGIRLLAGQDMALRQFYAHASDAPALLSVNGQYQDFSLDLGTQGRASLQIKPVAESLPQAYRSVPLSIAGERVDIALHSPEHALAVLSGLLELQTPDADTLSQVLALDDRDTSSYLAQANLATRIGSTDAQDGDKVAALLKVFASLPEGSHLSGHLDSLTSFISAQANPAFQRLLKDELSELVLRRRYADVGLGYKRMLGLLVMAEMTVSHPDTAAYIQGSVLNRQDLSLWLDWMAMPANGWAFLEASVPYVEQKCTVDVAYALEGTADQVPYNPCRLNGAAFANWVESIKAVAPEYDNDPQYLLTLLDGMYQGLGESTYSFRRDLFSLQQGYDPLAGYDPLGWLVPRAHAAAPLALVPVLVIMARVAVQVAKRAGRNFAKNLTKFMTGNSNTRLHPLLFAVATSYVYTSVTCDEESVIPCKRLQTSGPGSEGEAEKKFWSLMKHFAAGLALSSGKNLKIKDSISADGQYVCRLVNFTHGHMYEMFMIAFYHATSDQGVAALDRARKIPLYGDPNDLSQMFVRRPDIELKGTGVDINTWIELKSLQAAAHDSNGSDSKLPSKAEFLKRKLPQLGREQGRSTYHRQFTLDRVAAYGMQGEVMSEGFHWQLQQWKADAGPRNRLSNGYPTKTRIKGSDAGTYLEAAKERLVKPPLFFKSSDSKYPFHMDLDPAKAREVFSHPLYDGLGENIDEQLAEKFLGDLGYSAVDVADIKQRMADSANVLKMMEEVIRYVPGLEPGFGFDIIDLLPDEMLERVQDYIDENLGNMVGCEDD
ncbi:hypothetical protein DNK34_20025 [Pseudomonas dryadis]|uniref:Uncharacterized protein n=2 Tax=Pseudomonadales TaxID=72274 RepID=A0ABY1Z1S3_9GAMM|nr:hypothetical protein DNK34_20025 [Pseudomonas dryadis]TBV12561.1 hypothetical protein DNK41_24385 [Pseudomonas sp. FRB 230]